MLQLDSVQCRYGRRAALHGVSLHVRRGDLYGLLGHNGAGKTTLLRCALGLLPRHSGEVRVCGFPVPREAREAAARSGALVESAGLDPGLDLRSNLLSLSRLAGRSRADARREADHLLDVVGLRARADLRASRTSAGMRQRLGLAQALVGDPELVLLDEPTNGLDPEGIADLRALLVRLVREEGKTVVFSSHQLAEVSELCNRIAVLREGQVVIEARTSALLESFGGAALEVEARDAEALREAIEARGLQAEPLPVSGFRVSGEQGAPAPDELVTALVRAGVPPTRIAPERARLENLYLAAIRGEFASVPAEALPSPAEEASQARAQGPDAAHEGRRAPARPVWRACRFELARLFQRPRTLFALWLLPGLAAIFAVGRRALEARAARAELEEEALYSATAVTAYEAFGSALRGSLPLCALLLAALASQSFSTDRHRGVLRATLLQSVGRGSLAIGRALAWLMAGSLCYLLVAGVGYLAAGSLFPFEGLVELLPNGATFALVPEQELAQELRAILFQPLLPLLALATLGLLAGALARTAAGALALALTLTVGLDLLRAVARSFDVEGLLLSAHLPSLLAGGAPVDLYLEAVTGVGNIGEAPPSSVVVGGLWLACAATLLLVVVRRRAVP